MENDWALVVGINRYPLAGVKPLKGAVHDAEKFHEWLIDEKGGNVDPNQVTLLLSPPKPSGTETRPKPVLSQIFEFFETLPMMLGGGHGRRLYVYLSGHGISPSGTESVRNAALLMANARSPNLWHNFPGNIWAEGARSAALFREVVLIMDCCRDLKNSANIHPHIFGEPVSDAKDCLLVEAYATGWASKAREAPIPPTDEIHGFFTYSLLEVLRSGRMTGTVLKASVLGHLAQVLEQAEKTQEPEIKTDEALAKIVFNEQAEAAKTNVTIIGHTATPPTIEVWPEGADEVLQIATDDWAFEDGIWQGDLEPGIYFLRPPAGPTKKVPVLAGVPAEVVL
jgi:uncharacterized caspase-like protein